MNAKYDGIGIESACFKNQLIFLLAKKIFEMILTFCDLTYNVCEINRFFKQENVQELWRLAR